MAGASLILVYLAVVPVGTMLYASFHTGFLSSDARWSLANYVHAFANPAFYGVLANTLVYGGAVDGPVTIAIALAATILMLRTDGNQALLVLGAGVVGALVIR